MKYVQPDGEMRELPKRSDKFMYVKDKFIFYIACFRVSFGAVLGVSKN
jgi:hypothetical protein